MKTFPTTDKRSAPAVSRSQRYVHHPMGPVQQGQQTAMRKILRPDEVQAMQDIGENDGKYEQEEDRVADAVMQMPEPGVQREAEPEEEEKEEELI